MCTVSPAKNLSDRTLLLRYGEPEQDDSSIELIRRHGIRVRRRIGKKLWWSPEEAEDSEQQFWMELQAKKLAFPWFTNDLEPVSRWLSVCASNLAADRVRRLGREHRRRVPMFHASADEEDAAPITATGTDRDVYAESLLALRAALAQQPAEDRALLILVRASEADPTNTAARKRPRRGIGLGSMGQAAVAELLGYANAGAVHRHLTRIASSLRNALGAPSPDDEGT